MKPLFASFLLAADTRKIIAPFHNRICKVCSLVAATLILPTLAYADNNRSDDHGDGRPGVPNGTYSITENGWVPANPNQAPVVDGQVPLAGSGQQTFFANGTTSGVAAFTAGGQVFSITFKGTFTPNGDGSFSETDNITSINPPFQETVHKILYPTPDGNTIAFLATDPGSTLNGVFTRH